MDSRSARIHDIDLDQVPLVQLTDTAEDIGASTRRRPSISPRLLAAVWLGTMVLATAIDTSGEPATPPPLYLQVLGEVSAMTWLATIAIGLTGWRGTRMLGFTLGGLFLFGHLLCGLGGHVPMTSAVYLTQLALIGGATAATAATRLKASGTQPTAHMTDGRDEEAAYRARVRAWLAEHGTPRGDDDIWLVRSIIDEEAARARFARNREWQHTLYEGGFAGIAWPAEYGGGGGQSWQVRVFGEEAGAYEEETGFIGSTIAMLGPTLLHHGSEEQKRRFIPALLSAELTFCQLFSEPGAGSDLAGLAASAVADGDVFVLNGQKVWNSAAQFCDWGFVLARTDPDAPKHRGISLFLVDMTTPGIDVRPLVQMSGAAHFNEVFLEDVAVPAVQLVGQLNGGWAPARTVLANESAFIGGGGTSGSFAGLLALARLHAGTGEPVVRQRLADLFAREHLQRLMGEQIQTAVRRGDAPPIDPGLIKLYATESKVRSGDLAMALAGPASLVDVGAPEAWGRSELYGRYNFSIGGGTNEVQRNNLAERVLGLPREPRTDKDVPWREIPRS